MLAVGEVMENNLSFMELFGSLILSVVLVEAMQLALYHQAKD